MKAKKLSRREAALVAHARRQVRKQIGQMRLVVKFAGRVQRDCSFDDLCVLQELSGHKHDNGFLLDMDWPELPAVPGIAHVIDPTL